MLINYVIDWIVYGGWCFTQLCVCVVNVAKQFASPLSKIHTQTQKSVLFEWNERKEADNKMKYMDFQSFNGLSWNSFHNTKKKQTEEAHKWHSQKKCYLNVKCTSNWKQFQINSTFSMDEDVECEYSSLY